MGPLKHGMNYLEKDLHGDERRHDPRKHVEVHLNNFLKEVMEEILVDHE